MSTKSQEGGVGTASPSVHDKKIQQESDVKEEGVFANPSPFLVYALLLAAQFMYGGYHVYSKVIMTQKTSPFIFSLVRDLITTPLFFIMGTSFQGWRAMFKIDKADLPRFIFVGMTGIFGNQILFLLGVKYTDSSNAAIMQPLIPVFATIFSVLCGIEKLRLPSKAGFAKILGVASAVGGAIIMVDIKNLITNFKSKGADSILIGNLCLVGNCAAFATYIIIMKPLLKKYHAVVVTAWAYLFGSICMVLATIPSFVNGESFALPSSAWLAIAYASVISSGLAKYLISWCNSKASGVVVTVFMAAQPMATTLLAYLILKEQITQRKGFGALFLIFGLLSVGWSKHKEAEDEKLLDSKVAEDEDMGKPLLLDMENEELDDSTTA